jgi:hypothetical protein
VRRLALLIFGLFLGVISIQGTIWPRAQEGEMQVEADLSILLPDDQGKILVATYCAMCHSLKNTIVGSRDSEQWTNTIEKMVFEYNAPMSEEEIELSSTYLGKYAGLTNPIKEIPLDLNSVSGEGLARLSFLSSEDVQLIVEYREEKGPFSKIEQLSEVVRAETMEKMRPYLTIHTARQESR